MAPKIKVTKEDIVNTCIKLVRESGAESINARAIASMLDCSTQPIFSNFTSMEELEQELVNKAYEIYISFLNQEAKSEKYPKYKSFGMAYIRFAKEEKELFKLLFMCDRKGQDFTPTLDFNTSVEIIMNANGFSKEKATLLHLEVWSCVHGIASMIATSFLELDWDLISNMLSDVYLGLKAKHLSEDN